MSDMEGLTSTQEKQGRLAIYFSIAVLFALTASDGSEYLALNARITAKVL